MTVFDITSNDARARLAATPPPGDYEPFPEADLDQSIVERFEQMVRHHGPDDAVRTDRTSCTYDELNAATNRVAHAVLAATDDSDDPVVVLVAGDISPVVATFGVLKAGKIYVPLDPGPVGKLVDVVNDAGARVIVTQSDDLEMAKAVAERTDAAVIDIEDLGDGADSDPSIHVSPDSISRILYTSGSTGTPKGVTRSHREVLAVARGLVERFKIAPSDRIGMLGPVTFSGSASDMFLALLTGACLLPFDVKRRGLTRMRGWLRYDMPTSFYVVPSLFRSFIRTLPDDIVFASVRHIRFGAEPLYRADFDAFRRHFCPESVATNSLGSTEVGVFARFFMDGQTKIETEDVPSGYEAEVGAVTLVDDDGKPVPDGTPGNIRVRTKTTARYWNAPALNAESFIDGPDGEVLYRTGDRAVIDEDGCLHYLGREDRLVKVRGNRVETGEVELVIHEMPGVLDVAVKGHTDADNDTRLIAYVVTERKSGPKSSDVRAFATDRLASHAVPAQFVLLAELPRTARGKLDWDALPDPEEAPSSGSGDPMDHLERTLVAIWQRQLKVTKVGVHDDFFDLGGSSIEALAMFSAVAEETSYDLAPTVLINAPTIRQLADLMRVGAGGRHQDSLIVLRPSGIRTPVAAVHGGGGGIFFARGMVGHIHPDRPVFGLQAKGFDGVPGRYRSIEDIAAGYIAELQTAVPQGPYAIVGLSFGGLVAWEMGQQLTRAGETVTMVGLLDTKPRRRMSGEVRAAIEGMAVGATSPTSKVRRYAAAPWRKMRRMMIQCAIGLLLALKRPLPDKFKLRGNYFWRIHAKAAHAYQVEPYAGRVAIISEHGATSVHEELWGPLVTGVLTVHEVAGSHLDLDKEPHLGLVVAGLEKSLQEAEQTVRRS